MFAFLAKTLENMVVMHYKIAFYAIFLVKLVQGLQKVIALLATKNTHFSIVPIISANLALKDSSAMTLLRVVRPVIHLAKPAMAHLSINVLLAKLNMPT